MENWILIKDFPKYEVSNEGRVRNIVTGQILKGHDNGHGYETVTLYKDGRAYTKKIHRLVAEAFLESSHDHLEVNHIDGNKTNNRIENLEWCSGSENIQHAYDTGLRQPPRMKQIKVLETGEVYKSMTDCARAIGGTVSGLYDCEKGKQSSHRGYHFEWLEEEAI